MTVQDIRDHLATLPQEMEVMAYQDEMGHFYPIGIPRIEKVQLVPDICGAKSWDMSDDWRTDVIDEKHIVRVV